MTAAIDEYIFMLLETEQAQKLVNSFIVYAL